MAKVAFLARLVPRPKGSEVCKSQCVTSTGGYTVPVSGSGGDTGYDFQADAIAYVAAHALSGQPLSWFDDHKDIPSAWLAETGGPGDDTRIINTEGLTIELQAKHGLQKGEEYNVTFRKLINGLHSFPQLRAVLLVDHHASLIIRDDLKRDLVRLGQGRSDDIRPITRELLDDLQMQGLSGIAVFARFRIVVVDLDPGSDGAAAAQAMLTRVVAAKDSPTAYTLLGKRGHQMIKNRGRDDVYQCAKFLDTSVGLASVASSPAITMTRFAKWVLASYGTFYSPALQSNFPMHRAWSQVALMDSETEPEAPPRGLDKLEAQIKRYQEWARLLHRRGNDSALAADTFAAAHRLSVIVGGPGSGKSTIGRRLAFQGAEDRLAVLVRLPTVGALLASGNTFEAALIAAGTDSSGCNH